jgi:hypothetical protein
MRATLAERAAAYLADQRRHHARDGTEARAWRRLAGHRNRSHQAARVGVPRHPEHRSGGSGFHDLARIHHGHAVRGAGYDAQIMRDQQHGDAEIALQIDEQPENLRLDRHVERGGRLVGDEQCRPAHQRHGNHHALAQAARELMRELAEPLAGGGDADLFHQLDRALARRLPARALVAPMHFRELIADGVGGIERGHRLLEHHGHSVAAQRGEPRRRRRCEILRLEPEAAHAAARGRRQQAHQRERGHGFAAAGFADETQRFAALDAERHVAHRMQRPARRFDVDREPVDLEQRHVRPFRPRAR